MFNTRIPKSFPVARELEQPIEDSAVLVRGFTRWMRRNHPEEYRRYRGDIAALRY